MHLYRILLCLAISVSFSYGISIPYFYLKYAKQRAIDIIDKAGPKGDCSRHLKAWIGDLFNVKKLWALQMLDATAKLQTGILTGNIVHWGNYDQCLQISEDKGKDGVIEGQYCTVALLPAKNASSDTVYFLDIVNFVPDVMGIKEAKELKQGLKIFKVLYGLCFPKSCSADNVQKLWDYMEYTFRLPVHVSLNANFCSEKGKVVQEFYFDKYVIWTFGIFIFLICLVTLYDMKVYGTKEIRGNLWEKILTCFSVHRNLRSIFNFSSENKDPTLSCINGLKVFSMLWVIFGHRHAFGFMSGNLNMVDYFEWRKSPVALFVLLAPFAVDTFLSISGLLLAYKYMEIRNMLPPNQSMPYFMFYILRFFRLWPALIPTILFYISVIKYLNSGPLWNMMMYRMSLTCANTGWLTAFFMTNMVEYKYQCLEQAWYLAMDTQLYCAAPILLYFLFRYPKRTTLMLILLSCISAWYVYMVTVNTGLKWTLTEADEHYMKLYQSTFVRMPSWILGLLTGALLYSFQQTRIPKVFSAFTWISIILMMFGIAKVTNIMISTPYNEYSAGIYNALARPVWSLAICCLISLCAAGHGGIINRILSLKVYNVIAKFSYSTFLLHIAVISLVGGNKRTTVFFNSFTNFHAFLGDLPFIFVASVVWSVAFESPCINIAKVLTEYGKSPFKIIGISYKKRFPQSTWENMAVVKYFPKKKQLITKKKR